MSRQAWTAFGLAAIVTVLGAMILILGATKRAPTMAPEASAVAASQLDLKGWGIEPNAKKQPVASADSGVNYEIRGRMTD
ncbi:MAG: hypothetical protein HOP12_04570 [Candidatus Eisenbacteria bacterium]|uniref:Uncharacterized protein n=1 Tax=Eiseniibacteriota bacterium TaxID=2212470 RepID=A0A849SKQ5_UNCEI|nr:hypothetical protein [Candidatus Eisenbacteria bacterium]